MSIERELATFRRELPGLLKAPANVGKYVLIHGETIDSLHDTQEEALAAGYDRFGLAPFVVKQVLEHETPLFFSRGVTWGR